MNKNQRLNPLFALKRRVMAKGSLGRLWSHSYEGSHAALPEEPDRPTVLAMAEPAAEKSASDGHSRQKIDSKWLNLRLSK